MLSENLKADWEAVVKMASEKFGEGEELDLDSIIFLIGLQESGLGYRKFRKDDKINLIHIAICRLLEPYGYFKYEGVDTDGWPHFSTVEKLPHLKAGEQTILMKEAIVKYFRDNSL